MSTSTIDILNADILSVDCDVLVLKYAQGFHGADHQVACALDLSERDDEALAVGRHLRIPTKGRIAATRVLFVGVPQLWGFGYAEIRQFSQDALNILAGEDCDKRRVAMTMHGVGYGLDEREAFTAQVAGIMQYLQSPETPWRPDRITIAERDSSRAQRLADFLKAIQDSRNGEGGTTLGGSVTSKLPDAGIDSHRKKHVFVAMPYNEDMQDVFEFGICQPVHTAGCLCERCDQAAFTGDVLDRITDRITSATLVVADLTGSNPNVYLEVGYAWGRGVPTLLIAKKGEDLHFDVRTQRCIFYKSISDLRKQLSTLMHQLMSDGDGDGAA